MSQLESLEIPGHVIAGGRGGRPAENRRGDNRAVSRKSICTEPTSPGFQKKGEAPAALHERGQRILSRKADPRRRAGDFPMVRPSRGIAGPWLRPHGGMGSEGNLVARRMDRLALHFQLPRLGDFERRVSSSRSERNSPWNSSSPTTATGTPNSKPACTPISRSATSTPSPSPVSPNADLSRQAERRQHGGDRARPSASPAKWTASITTRPSPSKSSDPGFGRTIRVREIRIQIHRRLESMDRQIHPHARLRRRRIPAEWSAWNPATSGITKSPSLPAKGRCCKVVVGSEKLLS